MHKCVHVENDFKIRNVLVFNVYQELTQSAEWFTEK